jgi:hypothetical protein
MPASPNLRAFQADCRLIWQIELRLGSLGQPEDRRRLRQLVDRELEFDADFFGRTVALPEPPQTSLLVCGERHGKMATYLEPGFKNNW